MVYLYVADDKNLGSLDNTYDRMRLQPKLGLRRARKTWMWSLTTSWVVSKKSEVIIPLYLYSQNGGALDHSPVYRVPAFLLQLVLTSRGGADLPVHFHSVAASFPLARAFLCISRLLVPAPLGMLNRRLMAKCFFLLPAVRKG